MPNPSQEDSECSEKGIPTHLHQLERLPDDDFSDKTELLYRRYPLTDANVFSTIVFNRMSVNRDRYSDSGASDCLWDSENGGNLVGFGVAQFPVEALEGTWDHPDKKIKIRFSLKPEHHPEQCNYPHCEVVVFQFKTDDESDPAVPLAKLKPTSVKLRIREHLKDFINPAMPLK